MAGGSWGGGGDTPARLSAWCLSNARLDHPDECHAVGQALSVQPHRRRTRPPATGSGPAGKASKEYFLIENRQKRPGRRSAAASGLAVWHIDATQSNNNNPLAYKVALVQADGRRDLESC